MLLKTSGSMRKSKRKLKKYLETNDNKNTTIQNPWHASKVVLKGRFIVIQPVLKKKKKSLINNLTNHLKELEKEEQTKPKVSRRQEIIKNREKINKIGV